MFHIQFCDVTNNLQASLMLLRTTYVDLQADDRKGVSILGSLVSRLRVVPFFLRDSRASETRARVNITPREKGKTRWGERKMRALIFLSHRRVSPFSRGVIFTRTRVSLALLSLRKNGDYSHSSK